MNSSLLSKSKTGLVVIDIQEKFAPVIPSFEALVETVQMLIKGFTALELPVIVTEQYPKGLGATVLSLQSLIESSTVIEKLDLACTGEKRFIEQLEAKKIENCVLCGVETHICVLQTVFGLLERGITPYVVVDAVGSRRIIDHEIALQRISQAGAVVVTAEMCLFELTRKAGTEEFKAISGLVKKRSIL